MELFCKVKLVKTCDRGLAVPYILTQSQYSATQRTADSMDSTKINNFIPMV